MYITGCKISIEILYISTLLISIFHRTITRRDCASGLPTINRERGDLQEFAEERSAVNSEQFEVRVVPTEWSNHQSWHSGWLHVLLVVRNRHGSDADWQGSKYFLFSMYSRLLQEIDSVIALEMCHLSDGAHFGEIALLVADQRRVASVIAIEVCEVYRLDRKDFRQCIDINSELFAEIERIATERVEKTVRVEEQHKRFLMRPSRIPNLRSRPTKTKV